jgi:regulator of cell morphogenesis and NO signaling
MTDVIDSPRPRPDDRFMINESQTVADIAVGLAGAVHVFEANHIDYCCGGKRTLREACERARVPVIKVMTELDALGPQSAPAWGSLPALVAHIIDKHHAAARDAMEHIGPLVSKVCRVHGDRHVELVRVVEIFDEICADLAPHMRAEEGALFPAILQIARPDCDAKQREELRVSITVMQHDHDTIGRLLHLMRDVTNDYTPPEDACTSYRALYVNLEAFEGELHQHIHLENNVLLPRALAT